MAILYKVVRNMKIKIPDSYLNEIRDMLVDSAKEEMSSKANAVAQETKEIYKELYRMMIQAFYADYITVRYIRHGQKRAGTGTGINLYKSFNAHISRSGKYPRRLIVELDGHRMEDYETFWSDSMFSADGVVDNVLSGWRSKGAIPMRWEIQGWSFEPFKVSSVVGANHTVYISPPSSMDDFFHEVKEECEGYYTSMLEYAAKKGIKETVKSLGW